MPPRCEWCGGQAVALVEVDPSLQSGKATVRKQNRTARQLPACRTCRARLASRGHRHFPVAAQAWVDYWERRQGALF